MEYALNKVTPSIEQAFSDVDDYWIGGMMDDDETEAQYAARRRRAAERRRAKAQRFRGSNC